LTKNLSDAVATFDYYAELATQLDERQNSLVALPDAGYTGKTRFEPLGAVGMIVPWNFPLVTNAWEIAPALAAGCTVVLKTSEYTPLELSFTGSNAVGSKVMSAAAARCIPLSLALGGKSPILVFADTEVANDGAYGLVGTVVSGDLERAERVAASIDAGHIWINAQQVIFPQNAWGGFKASGIGRELGRWGLDAFLGVKHITLRGSIATQRGHGGSP
jgi:betaine-aldehyde dehydrogenase